LKQIDYAKWQGHRWQPLLGRAEAATAAGEVVTSKTLSGVRVYSRRIAEKKSTVSCTASTSPPHRMHCPFLKMSKGTPTLDFGDSFFGDKRRTEMIVDKLAAVHSLGAWSSYYLLISRSGHCYKRLVDVAPRFFGVLEQFGNCWSWLLPSAFLFAFC